MMCLFFLGNDLCVVNENNINPLICATNGEECHIPDNYGIAFKII
jgi:hypothetical protein